MPLINSATWPIFRADFGPAISGETKRNHGGMVVHYVSLTTRAIKTSKDDENHRFNQ